MKNIVRRTYVEKKVGNTIEADALLKDLQQNLGIRSLERVRIINRYDISGITDEEYASARITILSEPPVDYVYDENIELEGEYKMFAKEFQPGQYDQRADSTAQCIQILTQKERPVVRVAKLIVLYGEITDSQFAKIKEYSINPLDSREAIIEKPQSLEESCILPADVKVLSSFNDMQDNELAGFMSEFGFAMSFEDLKFCQSYFRDKEKRNPTVAELKVIDTYWSDHCRHTTFLTELKKIEIEKGRYSAAIEDALGMYMETRAKLYVGKDKDVSLMDIAVIGMKELRKAGKLDDMEDSEENNACSIVVDVDIDGIKEEWLVMFKNETHNHPTEIEPFGGAATCLGGAIRDPLSGRAYVYGAMRVTGSADPRKKIEETLSGKLPQKKITTTAAAGYSSYGNQIGLATGQVAEIYDEDYVAKRMEIGAVIAAAPKKNVMRKSPEAGDIIILLGGRTGRDGCGGATGSSKEHDEESINNCGAEVQKGNPPTERHIQRLFRNPEVSKLIKKCNDFGAGGISVAIGELAPGLDIDLDIVPKKYDGLDGTELAISESQERMAVVVAPSDVEEFIKKTTEENLEAVVVAVVTEKNKLTMKWRGNTIIDISREFLDTNGVKQVADAYVFAPNEAENYFAKQPEFIESVNGDISKAWIENLQDLNVCSQKGLVERFDSSIGAGTILMPYGGTYQTSPAEGLAMKIPVEKGETNTATLMTYGYNPKLAKWSPFHGAVYAIVEAVSKIVAMGGDYTKIRLTLQEYYEKLGKDPKKWGKPLSALIGAYYAQKMFQIPAIGGKDSMSGTFKDINVPPTLVAFAVSVTDTHTVISQELKGGRNVLVLIKADRDKDEMPNFEKLDKNYRRIRELAEKGLILSASSIKYGGLAATASKMAFGNMVGLEFVQNLDMIQLFSADYGNILVEMKDDNDYKSSLEGIDYQVIAKTVKRRVISVNDVDIKLKNAADAWRQPLEKVFPTVVKEEATHPENIYKVGRNLMRPAIKIAKPRIFIPVFPGTNCEYDTAKAFEKAGGIVETVIFRNLDPRSIEESIQVMKKAINNSQIIAIPGGFSGGDEPDGSGKFIATAFRNPILKEAIMNLLNNRDGLMIGICNGFQALVKLGLVPYGEIRDMNDNSPTLTFNKIGRHMSYMASTRISSALSPWLANVNVGDIHSIAISHGEGRFIADNGTINELIENGQVATQYVNTDGDATYDIKYNPNGSMFAIEGITSPDGRVLGKMGHSERIGNNVAKNIPGEKDQKIFLAGVEYFK